MRLILVHGYLAHAAVLWPLARRLQRLGRSAEVFSYPSYRGDLDAHARRLALHLEAQQGPVALLGHSMGGLIIHRALSLKPRVDLSHRVFVATPHRGCRVARRSRTSPIARLMSHAVRMAAVGVEVPSLPVPTGVVLGSRDRVVTATEADLPDADDRLVLPFGHNELVLRPNLAHAVHRFLSHGTFDDPLALDFGALDPETSR